MKKSLILFILIIFSLRVSAENGIHFFKGTWAELQAEAQKQHKIIYVDVYTTWCGPCKMMEKNVFTNENVGETFNANFINYQLDAEKGEGVELAKKYNIQGYPTSLFLSETSDLLHEKLGAMSTDEFIKVAEQALKIAKNDKPLSDLEADFKAGKLNAQAVQILLNKLKLLKRDTAPILDEYLNSLPETEYKTESNLILTAKNISTFDSKAFEILSKAYQTQLSLPEELRYEVMGGIEMLKRENLKKVIEEKDKKGLDLLISVMKTKLFQTPFDIEEVQLEFAEKTKDEEMLKTIAVKKASGLMKLSNDDLRKQNIFMLNTFKMSSKSMKMDTTSEIYQMQIKYLRKGAESANANQLNSLAWGYYEIVDSKTDLEEALKWSIRSVELNYSPSYLDTEANLLFKLGKKKEAIKKMKETITLAKKIGEPFDGFTNTLKRMTGK